MGLCNYDNGGTKWFREVPTIMIYKPETRIKTVDGLASTAFFSMAASVFWFTNLDNRKRHEDIILDIKLISAMK